MKIFPSIIIALLFLAGCASDFKEVKASAVGREFNLNSSEVFSGYYYLGSDSSYHYFKSKWKYGPDDKFKIGKADMPIANEEPYGKTEIRIYDGKPEEGQYEILSKVAGKELYRKR